MCSLHMMYVEDEPIKVYAQRYGVNKSSLTLKVSPQIKLFYQPVIKKRNLHDV